MFRYMIFSRFSHNDRTLTAFKSNGKPFVIQTPGKQNFMVTSPAHIAELNAAPLNRLSLHAVAKEVRANVIMMEPLN